MQSPIEKHISSGLQADERQPTPLMRSGTAARLAGIPVATLRVWERRYGVVIPSLPGAAQRLYTALDVQRLKLLRQLTRRGHGIGSIARQPLEALQRLAAAQTGVAYEPVLQLDVVAVGSSAPQRLQGLAGCVIRAAFADLEAAERGSAAASDRIDLLFVGLSSLRPEAVPRILALRARFAAAAVSVLYSFGTEASAEVLRAAGVHVRREPISTRELARMITLPRGAVEPALPAAAPRRFDDVTLVALAQLPSAIACECRRHVAEIVMQLAGFERYSSECGVVSPADAELHARLTALAQTTRTLFEQALEHIVAEETRFVPELARTLGAAPGRA